MTSDDPLVLADPSLNEVPGRTGDVPDFSDPPPPLWWVRPDVPDTWLHRVDPARPGVTACRLRLNRHFRPATRDEVRTRRKCRICAPPPPRARQSPGRRRG